MSAIASMDASEARFTAYRWLILTTAWLAYLLSFINRQIWTSVSGVAAESLGLSLANLVLFVTSFYVGYVV
jgi:sugar phosphate permease